MNYSIIIPSKNNPDQLERCIKSIPIDISIEIIVVDDCSNECALFEIDRICKSHLYTKLIKSNNSFGAGHARNMGLECAQGEWIVFSDSDDYFEKEFWGELKNITTNNTADILYFKVKGVLSTTLEEAQRGSNYNLYVESYLNCKKNAEERLRFYHMVPWGKVFRKSFIDENGIRFDEVIASNDLMFNVKAGSMAKKIDAYNILMYYVTVSTNSLTKNKSKEVLHCRFLVYLKHYKYVMSLGKPQCTYNLFKFAYKYSKPYGLKEFLWYFKQMIIHRTNPFMILYRINRYA